MVRLILSYFIWHYTTALKDLFNHAQNFLWFVFHFFSISVLIKTLFSPWQKLNETYRGGFNLNAFFETFVVNILMRIVGFFIRLVMIVAGIISLVLTFLILLAVFVIWLVLPLIITVLFISGVKLLF